MPRDLDDIDKQLDDISSGIDTIEMTGMSAQTGENPNTLSQSLREFENEETQRSRAVEFHASSAPPAEKPKVPDTAVKQFEITLSPDAMSAFLSLTYPGDNIVLIGLEGILQELARLGVVHGIHQNSIVKSLTEWQNTKQDSPRILAASGKEPENGKDMHIAFLADFQAAAQSGLDVPLEGQVCLVEEKTQLVTVTLPTPGTPGVTVQGKPVPAIAGKGVFKTGSTVVVGNSHNGQIALAKIAGLAHFHENTLNVLPYSDAAFAVSIDDDRMRVRVSLKSAVGYGKKLDEETLFAALNEKKLTVPLKESDIRNAVNRCNESEKPLQEELIAASGELKTDPDGRIHGQTVFGEEIKGGAFELSVSADNTEALLSVTPPVGGAPAVKQQDVIAALKKMEIGFGVNIENIAKALDEAASGTAVKDRPIAQGQKAQKGRDAMINFEKGFVPVKEFNPLLELEGEVCRIEQGALMATVLAATLGTDGKTVFGKPISAENGGGGITAGKHVTEKTEQNKIYYSAKIGGLAHFHDAVLSVHLYRDGTFTIDIAPDKMQASILFNPPLGYGRKILLDEIRQAVTREKITFGVDEELLIRKTAEVNESNTPDPINLFFAAGLWPKGEPGTDSEEMGTTIFGEPVKHGHFTLTPATDRMSCRMTVHPPAACGVPITKQNVLDRLTALNIVFGIQEEAIMTAIEQALTANAPQEAVIAEGQPVKNGVDSEIQSSVPFMDHEKLGLKTAFEGTGAWVKEGTQILTFCLESHGEKGRTIFGEELKAQDGVRKLDTGSHIKTEETTTMVALFSEIDGLAVLTENSISLRRVRNSEFRLEITEDRMTADLVIFPSIGIGNPLTPEDIFARMKSDGIVYGIDEGLVRDKTAECETHKRSMQFTAAKGLPRQDGENGRVDFHIKTRLDKTFALDETGRVDYREVSNVIRVHTDQHLFSVFTPTRAVKDGKDIFGNILKATDGTPCRLKIAEGIAAQTESGLGRQTASLDTSTPVPGEPLEKKYFAQIDGRLRYEENTQEISVSPTLTLDTIDIEFGNVKFKGDVFVEKNIEDGMSVDVDGDLTVNGHIYMAKVTASGSVVCEGGINTKSQGFVHCSGNLTTKYIENSVIECGGTVMAEKAVINSTVFANHELRVETDGSHIIGGEVFVKHKLAAFSIGNDMGARTLIHLGVDLAGQKEANEQIALFKDLRGKLDQVELVLKKLEKMKREGRGKDDKTRGLFEKGNAAREKLQTNMKILKQKISDYHSKQDECEGAELTVTDTMFADTVVVCGHARFAAQSLEKNIKLTKKKGLPELGKSFAV